MRRREREVVEPNEIRDIIEACKVCRLGFCEEGEVYIVPVNFGYDMKGKELTLYIHCAGEGRKIDLIRKNAKVGIEMDCHHELAEGDLACQYSYYYASHRKRACENCGRNVQEERGARENHGTSNGKNI